MQQALIETFRQWGLPRYIRVDNGVPLGDIQHASIPVLTLWLVGLDVKTKWNPPATPRDNAKVERMQGTSSRWVEIEKCSTCQELQNKLDQVGKIQREQYEVVRLGKKTRKDVYDGLWANSRTYSNESFNVDRVYQYLSDSEFVRQINKGGVFNFYGQSVYVGCKHRNKTVSLHFDSTAKHFAIQDETGETIAYLPAENFSREHILNLTVSNYRYVKCLPTGSDKKAKI